MKWLGFARKDWVICEGLQYLPETIIELKQKITLELIPHNEIKDIIKDIPKLLQAIYEIVGHIEKDSALMRDVLTKTSNRCPIIT